MALDRKRVNELFAAALERPTGDRSRFIESQAGADAALRDEVLSLVAAHDRAGSFLGHENQSRIDFANINPGLVSTLTPGSIVGPYRIDRELGRGGMGIVYLAEDTRLGRKVALKSLVAAGLLTAPDDNRRERLRKEARSAARLSHPGIATVYALEEIDDDLFIASEYVPGDTLRAEIKAGDITVDRLLDIGAQLSSALAAAHSAGVVHRDLKPENIVCTANGTVKILDFGIARLSADEGSVERGITATGTIVGTPAYMSPEQLETSAVDSRSDIFSLGVVLYEAATGVHPFEGSSKASTIARIISSDPRPPGELRRLLPAEFDEIVRRCLAKKPEARYQSAADIAKDVERLKVGRRDSGSEPASRLVEAREASEGGPIRWWRVHQNVIVTLYAVMTALVWFARETASIGGLPGEPAWSRAWFFAAVAAAALNGTLRVHLLFTERHNRPAFRAELKRATPWLRASDLAFGLVLLLVGIGAAGLHTAVAIVLAAVGAGSIIVSLAVEPATRDAAFADNDSRVATPERMTNN